MQMDLENEQNLNRSNGHNLTNTIHNETGLNMSTYSRHHFRRCGDDLWNSTFLVASNVDAALASAKWLY